MNRTPGNDQHHYGLKSPSKVPNMKDHFQTKNGGPNHGRWFYTCQKPQTKRCNFFLWDNEAKAREARAVLANSHTEPFPQPEPQTPHRTVSSKHFAQPKPLMTPYSEARPGAYTGENTAAHSDSGSRSKRDDDWLYVSDDDVETNQLGHMNRQNGMPPPETPSKTSKTYTTSSPAKRSHEDFQDRPQGRPVYGKPSNDIDLFNTPATKQGNGLFSGAQTAPQTRGTHNVGGLFSPNETPVKHRVNAPWNQDGSSDKIPVIAAESPSARKTNNIEYPQLGHISQTTTKPEIKGTIRSPLAQQILDVLLGEHVDVTSIIERSIDAISIKYMEELAEVKNSIDTISLRHMEDLEEAKNETQKQAAELARTVKSRDWGRDKIKRLEAELAELKGLSGKH